MRVVNLLAKTVSSVATLALLIGLELTTPLNQARAAERVHTPRSTRIRMGLDRSIVAIHPTKVDKRGRPLPAGTGWPHPRPRLAGFSPLIVMATSNARADAGDFEHDLWDSYVGGPVQPEPPPQLPPERDFVIGYMDTGAVVDLVAGAGRDFLGLSGSMLSTYDVELSGVGGTVLAPITQPLGLFAAGLSAVNPDGSIDRTALVGHSNVSVVAADPVVCGGEEAGIAVIGTSFLAFFDAIIRVDTPRTVNIAGETITGPDVQISSLLFPTFTISNQINIEFGGQLPVLTASYLADGALVPQLPTALSLSPILGPTGGAFFTTIWVSHGGRPEQPLRVLVDTGAQSSIISPGMAANLNLPLQPDFPVSVCGVGGLVDDVPGYYVDYVRINALGGELEFSRAPFVVLDLESPETGQLDGVLGMNFFWNRNVFLEPSITSSGFLSVSAPIPVPFGDNDVDFDVDVTDYEVFASCIPDAGFPLSPECDHLDADGDLDIDLADFGWFQDCFSGTDVVADPTCGSDAGGS